MKCPRCEGTKFSTREFDWVWTDYIVDLEDNSVEEKEVERDLQEVFSVECVNCWYEPDEENEAEYEILNSVSDAVTYKRYPRDNA